MQTIENGYNKFSKNISMKFKLFALISFSMLVISLTILITCYQEIKKQEFKIENLNSKLNYYEHYNVNDTIQIIKIILNKLKDHYNEQTLSEKSLRILNYPYLQHNLKDFKINLINVTFSQMPGLYGNLPDNVIEFVGFKLNSDNSGVIELFYGIKKIFVKIIKRNYWEIERFIIAD